MYSVRQIAAMATDDPNVINEAGPEGGTHPGRENDPFRKGGRDPEAGDDFGYEVIVIDKLDERMEKALAKTHWGINAKVFETYKPLYLVRKNGKPYLLGSPRNRNHWSNVKDMPLQKASSALLKALQDAGVPEEMMPNG
jgi:hypothetical protein